MMKDKTQKDTNTNVSEEEIDLGNLFKVIGKGIKNFFNFIGSIFQNIFHFFILLLIFLKDHAVKLGLALLLGFIIGFALHKFEPKTYVSNMIIETNYGSGKLLYKQINYLNNLANKKDSLALSKVLNINIKEASKINGIKISAYQSEINSYKAYDRYLQKTDTIYTKGFKFEDFKKRIDEPDLRYHQINVDSKSKTVFSIISPSIIKLVENDYYRNLKDLKVNELNQKLHILNKNLVQIDSLRNTYKKVALKKAEKPSSSSTIEISKRENKKNENDIELFNTSNDILNTISWTNDDLKIKNNIVNIISDFDKVGVPDKKISHKKYFQLPLLFLGLMLGWILIVRLNEYLNSYKSNN